MEEKYRPIADRLWYISQSIGRNFKEQKRKGRKLANRSRKTSRSIGPTMRVAQQERRSIVACEPIDREPNEARDSVSADRAWDLSDRSAKAPHALRRYFPSIIGSEFPPKLGQTLCSINRIQFGRKGRL